MAAGTPSHDLGQAAAIAFAVPGRLVSPSFRIGHRQPAVIPRRAAEDRRVYGAGAESTTLLFAIAAATVVAGARRTGGTKARKSRLRLWAQPAITEAQLRERAAAVLERAREAQTRWQHYKPAEEERPKKSPLHRLGNLKRKLMGKKEEAGAAAEEEEIEGAETGGEAETEVDQVVLVERFEAQADEAVTPRLPAEQAPETEALEDAEDPSSERQVELAATVGDKTREFMAQAMPEAEEIPPVAKETENTGEALPMVEAPALREINSEPVAAEAADPVAAPTRTPEPGAEAEAEAEAEVGEKIQPLVAEDQARAGAAEAEADKNTQPLVAEDETQRTEEVVAAAEVKAEAEIKAEAQAGAKAKTKTDSDKKNQPLVAEDGAPLTEGVATGLGSQAFPKIPVEAEVESKAEVAEAEKVKTELEPAESVPLEATAATAVAPAVVPAPSPQAHEAGLVAEETAPAPPSTSEEAELGSATPEAEARAEAEETSAAGASVEPSAGGAPATEDVSAESTVEESRPFAEDQAAEEPLDGQEAVEWEQIVEAQSETLHQVLGVVDQLQADIDETRTINKDLEKELQAAQELCHMLLTRKLQSQESQAEGEVVAHP